MATDCIAQLTFRYQGLRAPVVTRFDQPHASSDGGLLVLKALDDQLGLTAAVAATLPDARQPGKVAHSVQDLVRQRVFGLVAGYLDGNDAGRLADDPIHKLVLDREPVTGPALGSQATLSRFENAVDRRALIRLGHTLARTVIAQHRRRLHGRAQRITLDLDPTDDPTYGQQELSLFNGHYGTACYLPLVTTLTFDDEPLQYLAGIVLRPGTSSAGRGAVGRLRWLLRELRQAFPQATIRVRLDGGFAGPALLAFLERAGVEYVVGLPGNPRLERRIRRLLGRARQLQRTTGTTTPLFGETRYAAQTWPRKRRVILKAEVVQYPGRAPRDNPRFVVTNLPDAPADVYAVYCQRGAMENRLKELKDSLGLGRTSCPRFLANQFRVLLTAIAYVLCQALQQRAQGTAWAGAQVATLRERLIKLAVWITRSVRRVVVHAPQTGPWVDAWRQLAHAVGARSA